MLKARVYVGLLLATLSVVAFAVPNHQTIPIIPQLQSVVPDSVVVTRGGALIVLRASEGAPQTADKSPGGLDATQADTVRIHDGSPYWHISAANVRFATRLTMPARATSRCTLRLIRHDMYREASTTVRPCSVFVWRDSVVQESLHYPGVLVYSSAYNSPTWTVGQWHWCNYTMPTGSNSVTFDTCEQFWIGLSRPTANDPYPGDDGSFNPDYTRNAYASAGDPWEYWGNDFMQEAIVSYGRIDNDVAVTSILAPTGTIDSIASVAPACSVSNLGYSSASYDVRLRIGGFYDQTVAVTNQPQQTASYVQFPAWSQWPRGAWTVNCSTRYASDQYRSNDRLLSSVTVRVVDGSAEQVTGLPDTIDQNGSATPHGLIINNGTDTRVVEARMTIGAGYQSTVVSGPLLPGTQEVLAFDSWSPTAPGTVTAACSTRVAGDMAPANDRVTKAVFVRARDAACTAVLAPSGTVDLGAVVTPRAVITNNGNCPEHVPARLRIGGYNQAATTGVLLPAATCTLDFPEWQATTGGTFAVTCSTELANDLVPGNDRASGSVFVAVRDVGVSSIAVPTGNIPENTQITPDIGITNYGNQAVTVDVNLVLRWGSTEMYNHTLTGISVPLGGISSLEFPEWVATPPGAFTAEATTIFAGDMVPGNDSHSQPFAVITTATLDVMTAAITSPSGTLDTSAVVTPRARVVNAGDEAATFNVAFYITQGATTLYGDTTTVSALAPGGSVTASFAAWPKPHEVGAFATRCTTMLVGDIQPDNDCAGDSFRIVARPPWDAGWHEMRHLPEGAPLKQVKDGGWLAYNAGNGLIYAAKGNKTLSFYAYDPLADTWTAKASQMTGSSSKPPSKGAHGCSDGTAYIYATKGNNTLAFYRYDIAANGWTQVEDVPAGGNKVKGGTDMAYVQRNDSGYVYLLKGYRNEFYRFNVASGHWETLASAPTAAGTKYDKGSFLSYDGADRIYVHQSKYNQLYSYNLATTAWTSDELHGMPLVSHYTGRSKKAKDGSAAAWTSDGIYALKGGNTQDYFHYYPQGDTWRELDTIPQFSSFTGRKKKVKAGGDLTAYGPGVVFAMKGNKTLELWRWVDYPTAYCSDKPSRDGVTASGRLAIDECRLSIAPNPMAGSRVLHLTNRAPGHSANVAIYDALGRAVFHSAFVALNSAQLLDLRNLPAGAYVVRLSSDGLTSTQKLVIER